MANIIDYAKNAALWAKSFVPGVNILPGDVTQAMTGVPAQTVWHATQPTAPTGTGVPPAYETYTGASAYTPLYQNRAGGDGGVLGVNTGPTGGGGGGGGGTLRDIFNAYVRAGGYAGWNDMNAAWADFQAMGGNVGGGGGGGGGNDEGAINAIYQPTMDYLGQLEQQYTPEEAARAGGPIETSYQESLIPIGEREATQKALIGGQEETVTGERASALAQARQLHQEGLQGIIGRFGAGSSTGPAASELLARQSMGMIRGIQEKATTALNALADEGRRLTDFVGRQKEVLLSKKNDALENLRREFRDKLASIQGMKGQVESEKAAKRLDQLNSYKEQAFQIEQADKAFQRQLILFESTKSEQLAQSFATNTGIAPEAALAFQRLLSSGRGYTPEAAATALGLPTTYRTAGTSPFMSPWEYLEDQNIWYNNETGETSGTAPAGSTTGAGNTYGVGGLFTGGGI